MMTPLALEHAPCAECGRGTIAALGGLPKCGACWGDVREAAGVPYLASMTRAGTLAMETALYAALAAKQTAAEGPSQ